MEGAVKRSVAVARRRRQTSQKAILPAVCGVGESMPRLAVGASSRGSVSATERRAVVETVARLTGKGFSKGRSETDG